MAEKTPGEFEAQDPLEQLLDEESDEEFGLPEFREHLADSLTPAVLKDWTAADFASIYVRFRPHLERHAKRFLVNPSQVEEVVQDAFLYLMTTLPELDSELGVLKFLKWKTRLLALDVIRANSRVSFAPLDDQPEIAAKVDEFSLELERADDAAIVALALAKLQPRHREALIATLYEEKASEVVAAQMGLNENAFRQLLFRARSAFKKALVGEAETAGLRVSEILSIAARKAAKESGKYISAAGAFLLVLAISIGVIPNLSQPAQEQFAAESPARSQPSTQNPNGQSGESSAEAQSAVESSDGVTEASASDASSAGVAESGQTAVSLVAANTQATADQATVQPSGESAGQEPANVPAAPNPFAQSMNVLFGQATVTDLGSGVATAGPVSSQGTSGTIELANARGLSVSVAYDLGSERGIQHTWITIKVKDTEFVAVPTLSHSERTLNEDGTTTLFYLATDLLIGDVSGAYGYVASDESALSRSGVSINLLVSASGEILNSELRIIPRS
jgi:RNA polymerase sigma-70 factor (ECF subfamily)